MSRWAARGVTSARTAVERIAWAVPLSSRRFFVVLALTVGLAVPLASVLASRVVEWNADDVATAQSQGSRVAQDITDLRVQLGAADTELAATLVRGGGASPLARARADDELRAASLSLTEAGVAAGANAERITTLGQDLVRYLALVETAWAYPVGSRFHDEARRQVRQCPPTAQDAGGCRRLDEAAGEPVALVTSTAAVREHAERDLAQAVRKVTSGWRRLWIVGLWVTSSLLVVVNVLLAGRTRIALHWLLAPATVVLVGLTWVVHDGVGAQRAAMQVAGERQVPALESANADLFLVLDLRSDELDAVSSRGPDRTGFYARFHAAGDRLTARLDRALADGGAAPVENLRRRVGDYLERVAVVEDELGAAPASERLVDLTLDGGVESAYLAARGVAVSAASSTSADLDAQLAAADRVGLGWWSWGLAAVGIAAGLAGAAGVLHQGREYLVGAGRR